MANKHNYKLTDEQFIAVLEQCNGVLGRVAAIIRKQYGVSYSRQGVYDRAKRFKKELMQIRHSERGQYESRLTRFAANDYIDISISHKIVEQLFKRLSKYDKVVQNQSPDYLS